MRLVLCDDHRLFLEPLAAALAGHGHEVATATNPPDAVRAVAATDPDVCVLDVKFRRDSGLDAARTIRQRFPRTRVLMLSATAEREDVDAALDAGASGFVRKDQAVRAVLDAIEQVAGGRVAVDPSLRAPGRGADATSPAGAAGVVESLTPREREVLEQLVAAHDTRQIAENLSIAESTARSHVQNLLVKLGVHSRLQAVAIASGACPPGR